MVDVSKSAILQNHFAGFREMQREQTFDEFHRYLRVKRSLSEKTADQHRYMAKRFVEWAGTMEPSEADVVQFRARLMEAEYSNSHVNNTQNAIEYYFEFQGRGNELGDFDRLARRKTKPNPLTDDQVDRLVDAAKPYRDRAMVLTLLSSGIRAGELAGLDVRDVDLSKGTVDIWTGKNHKDRTAFVSEQCVTAIEAYLDHRTGGSSGVLFLNQFGDRFTRSGVLDVVKRTAERAAIEENVYTHRLRDTFATRLWRQGADVVTIKELLGHDDVQSTQKYLGVELEELRDRYDEHMGEVAGE